MLQEDQAVLVLRDRFLEEMMRAIPSGALSAEDVRAILCQAEGLCESIANEDNPLNREFPDKGDSGRVSWRSGRCRQPYAACNGATSAHTLGSELLSVGSRENWLPPVMQITGRVPRVKRRAKSCWRKRRHLRRATPHCTRKPSIGGNHSSLRGPNREGAAACPSPRARCRLRNAPRAKQRLRLHIADGRHPRNVMRVLGAIPEHIPDPRRFRTGLPAVRSPPPRPTFEKELWSKEIQSEPPFSDDAPRITVHSLIVPGDKTNEGILVKGVSALLRSRYCG